MVVSKAGVFSIFGMLSKLGMFSKVERSKAAIQKSKVAMERLKSENFSTSARLEHLRVGPIRIVVLLIRQVT
jgi:hypothetical protein